MVQKMLLPFQVKQSPEQRRQMLRSDTQDMPDNSQIIVLCCENIIFRDKKPIKTKVCRFIS